VEHRLILGGEQYLPFARSCITKLKKLGLAYASQSYEIEGVSINVRIEPGHEYIRLRDMAAKGDFWCLSREFVGGQPALCAYSLDAKTMKAKRLASIMLSPNLEALPAGDIYKVRAAWVVDGVVETYRSESDPGSGGTTDFDLSYTNTGGQVYSATARFPAASSVYTSSSTRGGAPFRKQTELVSQTHPAGGGTITSIHVATTTSGGFDLLPPTFSYQRGALVFAGIQHAPLYYSNSIDGVLLSSDPPQTSWVYSPWGTVKAPEGLAEADAITLGLKRYAPIMAGGATGPMDATEASYTLYGKLAPRVTSGAGKEGYLGEELDYGYYQADPGTTIDPASSKYVCRLFKDYFFGFESEPGGVMARVYDYSGAVIAGAPVLYVPNHASWQGMQSSAGDQKFQSRRWINPGKDATVYEWSGMLGAVPHGSGEMTNIKTIEQVFGAVDLTYRESYPWFAPVHPYVVGPEISKMTPF